MSDKAHRRLAVRLRQARRNRNQAEKMAKRAAANFRKALRAYRQAA